MNFKLQTLQIPFLWTVLKLVNAFYAEYLIHLNLYILMYFNELFGWVQQTEVEMETKFIIFSFFVIVMFVCDLLKPDPKYYDYFISLFYFPFFLNRIIFLTF